jgi:hypothetical protein
LVLIDGALQQRVEPPRISHSAQDRASGQQAAAIHRSGPPRIRVRAQLHGIRPFRVPTALAFDAVLPGGDIMISAFNENAVLLVH